MSEQIVTLDVQGMSCQGCARAVTKIISKTLGLEAERVEVDLDDARATFPFEGDDDALAPALARLAKQGFEATRQP